MKTKLAKTWERKSVKRLFFLIVIVAVWWTVYSFKFFNPILFPGPGQIFHALVKESLNGSLFVKAGNSLYMIFVGLGISVIFAFILMVFAVVNKTIHELASTLIALLDPLPGLALLPLAILWFGIGRYAMLFVMVHSIVWPVLLSIIKGFDTVPLIYREVGMGIGLSKYRMVLGIYTPAAFPSILQGVKTGWSRAWRALIGAEMVFGAMGNSAGLGYDIYMKRSFMDMPGMFASLIFIMIIGILMEDLFFSKMEKATIVKWGMVQ